MPIINRNNVDKDTKNMKNEIDRIQAQIEQERAQRLANAFNPNLENEEDISISDFEENDAEEQTSSPRNTISHDSQSLSSSN